MYLVIEIQKNGDNISTLVDSFSNLNQAKSKYHTILAAASISSVDRHGACLLDDRGVCILTESYNHLAESNED